MLALACAAATSAAAGSGAVEVLTAAAWRDALPRLGLDPGEVVNPLAATPEMRQTARTLVERAESDVDRLERIQRYLFDPASEFAYDFAGTLTAAEAYRDRKGNCVAFTNLFIAMAREAGVPVQAALVAPRSGAVESENGLSIVRNHIVALHRHSAGVTVYDFYTSRTGAPISVRPIDDLWSTAIYENNLGVYALRANRLDEALDRFDRALRLAPQYAPVYGNLGVVRRRMGDVDGALDAHLVALLIEPRNSTFRGNLLEALRDHADTVRSGYEQAKSSNAGDAGFLRLLLEGAETLLATDVRRARSFYRQAHGLNPQHTGPLVGLARCELLSGRPSRARQWLEEVLQLEPDHVSARRLVDAIASVLESGSRKRDRGDVDVAPRPSWGRGQLGSPSEDLL